MRLVVTQQAGDNNAMMFIIRNCGAWKQGSVRSQVTLNGQTPAVTEAS